MLVEFTRTHVGAKKVGWSMVNSFTGYRLNRVAMSLTANKNSQHV
jgi:hypothetical protein